MMRRAPLLPLTLLLFTGCSQSTDGAVPNSTPEPLSTSSTAGGPEVEVPPHFDERLSRMTERLELDENQAAEVRTIMLDAHARRGELRDMPGEERRAAREALHGEIRDRLEGVLDEEQLARFERMRHHRHGRHGRGHHLRRLARALELTDEQRAQVRPIFEGMRDRHRALRQLPPSERREAAESFRAEVRSRLEGVLTPEQLTRFDEMAERHAHGPFGRIAEHLELTEEQIAQVRPIFDRAMERRWALREMEPEQRREAAQQLRTEIRAELAEHLTEEQLTRVDEHFERRRHHRRHGRGFHHR